MEFNLTLQAFGFPLFPMLYIYCCDEKIWLGIYLGLVGFDHGPYRTCYLELDVIAAMETFGRTYLHCSIFCIYEAPSK